MQDGLNVPGRVAYESPEAARSRSAQALRVWIEFAQEPRPTSDPADLQDAEVNETLEEFGGDFRAAIRALLHDLAALAGDFASHVSRGYVRGGASKGGRRVNQGKVDKAAR